LCVFTVLAKTITPRTHSKIFVSPFTRTLPGIRGKQINRRGKHFRLLNAVIIVVMLINFVLLFFVLYLLRFW